MAVDRKENFPLAIVLCEGRSSDVIGVKLLLASLQQHAPQAEVLAYISQPMLGTHGEQLAKLHQRLELIEYRGPENWSCKPAVLLSALAERPGHRLLWVDVDILVLGDFSELARVDPGTLIVAEESNPNDNARVAPRQQALQMEVGKPRETTISSCIIGVTSAHTDLLTRWQTLMEHPAFLAEQALPPGQRKLFMGDQEVWEAVLCEPPSRDQKLHWLLNDAQMLQANYTRYRPRMMSSYVDRPQFAHATGNLKPWRQAKKRMAQEMFPYFWLARPYLELLTPEERAHFTQRNALAGVWRRLGGGFTTYRAARRLLNRLR